MKQTRKISIIVTCILLLAFTLSCFVGCGKKGGNESSTLNGKTVEEIYEDAKKWIAQLSSYDMSGTLAETVSAQGQTMELSMDIVQKMKDGKMYSKTSSDDEAFAKLVYELWADSSVIYEITNYGNAKVCMGMQEFMESEGFTNYASNMLLDLDSSLLGKAKFKSRSDGNYDVTININVNEYFDMLSNSSLASLVSAISADDIKNFTVTMTFDPEGTIVSVNTEIKAAMEIEGIKATVTAECLYTITPECGEIPAVPEGAENWPDYTNFFKK